MYVMNHLKSHLVNMVTKLECAASNGNRYPPYPQVMDGNSHLPIMTTALLCPNPNLRKNAVNEQTDRWTNNNIHKHPWMLSVSHLDTSACQIVGHFFQALCMQYTNPSPWMVGRTDERMKWQQYPSASMLAKGKSSGNICISNSMPFLPSDLSANVIRNENSKMSKKSHHFLTLWPWPLTYDLEKLIRSGHYHYQCVYQIWEQSIPWLLSYRVNTIAGGGWRATGSFDVKP